MRVEHLLLEKEVSDIMKRIQNNGQNELPLTQLSYSSSDNDQEDNSLEVHNTLLENIVYQSINKQRPKAVFDRQQSIYQVIATIMTVFLAMGGVYGAFRISSKRQVKTIDIGNRRNQRTQDDDLATAAKEDAYQKVGSHGQV